jgi:hypothetical protein
MSHHPSTPQLLRSTTCSNGGQKGATRRVKWIGLGGIPNELMSGARHGELAIGRLGSSMLTISPRVTKRVRNALAKWEGC